ncbi:fucose-1-phosphate guanylyltransferase-like [Montipora capricornis]|uniref:fucose-1-phosphate guanylyltransferase-like n=1 Tax=Montipora capricornis TaxID=246305 RepID=UPI0035F1669B
MTSFSQTSNNIRNSTAEKLKLFESIRGKDVGDIPFWDAVVITALDESQKEAYEIQVQCKLDRGELPLGVKYLVFHDPPGPKIGNGGSVLVTIGDLLKIYDEEELLKTKIILLPAGGYSQRLPNASVLGKAFTALPIGDPPFQMLELQLIMMMDLPAKMNPGIFVVASDCLEFFNSEGDWSLTSPGFTAFAHPSPIIIGTTHGVFVLDDHKSDCPVTQTTCKKFLHKPSTEVMRNHGITFLHNEEEHVFTDSAYFVDWKKAKSLYDFSDKIKPIDCEIDAYGDFLQALGPEACGDYTKNIANVTKETASLVEKRRKIFEFLTGTQLNVLLLNESKFYHLGTTKEYIHHLCKDAAFRHESHFASEVMVIRDGVHEEKEKINTDQRCLIQCYLTLPSTIGQYTVLEYCDINSGSSVGSNCIISNVIIPEGACIPDDTFMTTVCVTVNDVAGLFVTVVFGIGDNVKKMARSDDLSQLQYLGMPLDLVLALLDAKLDARQESVSLWQVKLFPAFHSCKHSVQYAISMINSLKSGSKLQVGDVKPVGKHLSMEDVLAIKDIKGTLNIRENLRKKILAK